MKKIQAIMKKELMSHFKSPMGWVVFAIFMAVAGVYFASGMTYSSADMSGEIGFLQSMLFVIVPMLTMKSFSEEKRNGTDVLLLTSPATVMQIVIGKYLAALVVFLMMTAGTMVHMIFVVSFGGTLGVSVIGAYVGFILLGAAYLAIGIFASATTESQVISAVVTFVAILLLSVINSIASILGNAIASFVNRIDVFGWIDDSHIITVGNAIVTGIRWINPSSRLSNILDGIFEVAPLVFFISLVAVFLYLTMRVIEKRRWSQR